LRKRSVLGYLPNNLLNEYGKNRLPFINTSHAVPIFLNYVYQHMTQQVSTWTGRGALFKRLTKAFLFSLSKSQRHSQREPSLLSQYIASSAQERNNGDMKIWFNRSCCHGSSHYV